MLSVNPVGRNVSFNGFHQGTRKILSSESQKLLDRGIQEVTSAYNEVKGIRRGKGALLTGPNDSVTLMAQIPDGTKARLSVYNSKPDLKYHLEVMEKNYTENEDDYRNWSYIEFDKPSASEKVNFREVTPIDIYQIRDYRKMDENESILKKAEKFIKQYMPLFIPEK